MKLIEVHNQFSSYCIGKKYNVRGTIVDMQYIPISQWNYDNQILATKDYIQINFDGGYVIQLYDFIELIYKTE